AAIATNIGRGSAVIFQLLILFYGWGRIKLGIQDIILRVKVMMNLIKVSLGGIAQFLIGTSSWVFLMRIMSEFGSEVLAGYTIAIRVMMFTFMPAWGMSNAAATLVGQNLGAKQPDRAEKSVWLTGRYNAIFMLGVSVVYVVFAKEIITLFSQTPSVIENGALCLQVVAAGYLFYAYGMVISQSFNGAGDTRTPTKINFIAFWIFQLPFAYLAAFTFEMGALGVFLAITLAEVLLSVIAIIWFRKGYWKKVEV
ncbi:MAG: MATE family efflux transporter, partial [Eudoraea sp.]|nr:MATE family efflux transporter [Eudoraea sp.]